MFMMVKGCCAAPKGTCGKPPLTLNCIRSHLGERYDHEARSLKADMRQQSTNSEKTKTKLYTEVE